MKKILSYMAAGLMLFATSCSDDIFDRQLSEIPSDGQLEFRYSVPEMQGVQTRATDENAVHTLTLLIFDGSGKLQQVEALDPTKQSCDVTIDGKIRADKNISFLMLANAPDAYDVAYFEGKKNTISKDDVKTLSSDLTKVTDGDTDYLVMSGSASLNDILSFSSVALYRNAVKVSVNMGKKDADGNFVKDSEGMIVLDEALPFVTLGGAEDGILFAGAERTNPSLSLGKTPSSVSIPSTFSSTEPVFVHPTENKNSVYVIVKADYKGENDPAAITYYYRLDFETEDYLNLEPNHYYQFVIDEVKGKGYTTPSEAAANPTPKSGGALEWNIVDHSPRVYNIVTDGKSSLGVSNSITHTGDTGTEEFYVRIRNKNGEYENAELKAENFIPSKSWLTIGSITKMENTGDNLTSGSSDDGLLYKVEARFSRTSEVGSQTASITVRWNQLSRVIPVVWNREFNADDVVKSAVLQVYKDGATNEQWKENDYFDFLENKVWGVNSEANNGDARNEGFHFPLMYGDNPNNPWTYKYTVTLKNPDQKSYKWEVMVADDSDPVIRDNVKINGSTGKQEFTNLASEDGPTFELTMTSGSKVYGVGSLMVRVAPSGTKEWRDMPIAIYHTGFFHKDNYDHAVEGSYDNSKPYTYYGVVTIGENRWLDRNIGAHSAELYIEQVEGNTPQHGTTAGRGAYFYIAKQNGTEPELYSGICPPGYQVPYSTDWDALRKSSRFVTTNMGSYITAYYASDSKKSDGTALNVYFSKSLYIDGSVAITNGKANAGDNCVGYYWSQTTATGFEKEERGRWLRDFVIYGEATQMSNARVDYDSNKGFALNLRCVSMHSEVKDSEEVNFFVTGATHVYAYSLNSANERVPVTTWPGTPIANYSTANIDYINYRYVGKTTAENLYLIFNYKGKNGQIHSISKDGSSAKITTDVSPADLDGWKAKGDVAPNNSGDSNNKTAVNIINATQNVKYYWNINVKKASTITLTTEPKEIISYEPSYRIHGTIFGSDWDTPGAVKALSRESGSTVWKGRFTINTGEFVIQKIQAVDDEDSDETLYEIDAFKRPGGTGNITINTPTQCTTGASDTDGNFKISAGTYSFSFDVATQMLTVISADVPANTYRVYWNKNEINREYISVNSGEGISEGRYKYTGIAGNYYYFDTTAKKFNFCFSNQDGSNTYTGNNGDWWVVENNWGQAGAGYSFWVDAWNSAGSGLPSALR